MGRAHVGTIPISIDRSNAKLVSPFHLLSESCSREVTPPAWPFASDFDLQSVRH
jgi:hypothetical protein